MRALIFTTALFITFRVLAQDHFCGSTEAQNNWFSKHPELKQHFDDLQRQAEVDGKNTSNPKGAQWRTSSINNSAATYTIPMVFHILHTGGSENIADSQVVDAVRILNRDYRKLNADTSSVVAAFQSLIGDVKIEFRLATKDPNGNCTNGILRHWDLNTDWPAVDFNNYLYTWNPAMYLNVYIVKTMTGGAAGYTFLPGSGIPSNGDAVVILSTYIGAIGTGIAFTSRALTHEVGHWFNLQHPWGSTNQPGVACGDDGVMDTPITKGFSSCNLNNDMICTPGVEENVQNYMDYSYCSRMFTLNQVTRMQTAAGSVINGRDNLSTNTNLINTGVLNPGSNCIPELQISAPTYMACSGNSLSLNSYTFNANPTTYAWTADNGATVINPSFPNVQVVFNNQGNTNVTCIVSNANGSNSQSASFTILPGIADITAPQVEGFELGVLPPNWTVLNPTTPNVKWQITQDGASSGASSIRIAGDSLQPGAVEIVETPSYDFKNNPNARYSFYLSYARGNLSNSDLFKVQASKKCDGIWEDVWFANLFLIANQSNGTTSVPLITGSSGWIQHILSNDINFQDFSGEDNVRFRFYFQEDPNGGGYGNRLYLDDINFAENSVGINALTRSIGFAVYPNPSASVFNVDFTLAQPAKISYKVVSATGVVLLSSSEQIFNEGSHQLIINGNDQLSKGIYFLNFDMNGLKMNRKLIVN